MTGTGALVQLTAYGVDIYMTGNPEVTFFKPRIYTFGNFSMESNTESSFNSFYGKNTNYNGFKESFENFKPKFSKPTKNKCLKSKIENTDLKLSFETNNKIQYIQERREKIQRNLITDTKKLNLFLPDDITKLISEFII